MRAKLAHQVVPCGNILAAAEGYRLAAAAGLEPGALREVLRFGVASSRAAEHFEAILANSGAMHLSDKDLQMALEWAQSHAVELPATRLVRDCLPEIFSEFAPQ